MLYVILVLNRIFFYLKYYIEIYKIYKIDFVFYNKFENKKFIDLSCNEWNWWNYVNKKIFLIKYGFILIN